MQIVLGKKNVQVFGTFLNNIRCEEGIEQKALAAKVKTFPSYLSLIENNKRTPGLELTVHMLDALGYEVIIQKR